MLNVLRRGHYFVVKLNWNVSVCRMVITRSSPSVPSQAPCYQNFLMQQTYIYQKEYRCIRYIFCLEGNSVSKILCLITALYINIRFSHWIIQVVHSCELLRACVCNSYRVFRKEGFKSAIGWDWWRCNVSPCYTSLLLSHLTFLVFTQRFPLRDKPKDREWQLLFNIK